MDIFDDRKALKLNKWFTEKNIRHGDLKKHFHGYVGAFHQCGKKALRK